MSVESYNIILQFPKERVASLKNKTKSHTFSAVKVGITNYLLSVLPFLLGTLLIFKIKVKNKLKTYLISASL